MKQFIIKGIACLALLAAIDVAVGYTHGMIFGNLPDKTSMVSTIYYSLFKKSADVLILGSSTANHHYNSKMMEDSLGMSVYNSGLDGRDMIYFDVVLQSAIQRHVPKYVVLDIGAVHLDGSWINRISDTKLYYGENEPVTHYYDTETDWQQRLKLMSSTYRYNKTLSYLIRVAIDNPNILNGFSPMKGEMKIITRTTNNVFHVDSVELCHLNNIVSLCENNSINLVLVQSPQANDNVAFDKWIEDYSKKQNIELIEENKNAEYYKRPELFRDENHLNFAGANKFTSAILKNLKMLEK